MVCEDGHELRFGASVVLGLELSKGSDVKFIWCWVDQRTGMASVVTYRLPPASKNNSKVGRSHRRSYMISFCRSILENNEVFCSIVTARRLVSLSNRPPQNKEQGHD